MGKTIIQTIGPLYGEVVNGTVFGRPNGSVYVPDRNTMTAILADNRKYVRNAPSGNIAVCSSSGSISYSAPLGDLHLVAQSQDTANYIEIELAEDSDFTDIIGTRTKNAGLFNVYDIYTTGVVEFTIVNETSYYLRARLISASGVAVATSETITVVGWAS